MSRLQTKQTISLLHANHEQVIRTCERVRLRKVLRHPAGGDILEHDGQAVGGEEILGVHQLEMQARLGAMDACAANLSYRLSRLNLLSNLDLEAMLLEVGEKSACSGRLCCPSMGNCISPGSSIRSEGSAAPPLLQTLSSLSLLQSYCSHC